MATQREYDAMMETLNNLCCAVARSEQKLDTLSEDVKTLFNTQEKRDERCNSMHKDLDVTVTELRVHTSAMRNIWVALVTAAVTSICALFIERKL